MAKADMAKGDILRPFDSAQGDNMRRFRLAAAGLLTCRLYCTTILRDTTDSYVDELYQLR